MGVVFSQEIKVICVYPENIFSSRGVVTFSMQYRLMGDQPPGELTPQGLPINAAVVDAKTALRWIYAKANTYGIDTNNIFISGSSAGAITSLLAGATGDGLFQVDVEGTEIPATNSPGYSMDVKGIIDFCGGLYTMIDSLDSNDPPILIYHGTADNTVPFTLAKEIVERAKLVELEYEFYPIEGGGHCPGGAAENGKTLNQLSFAFLVKHSEKSVGLFGSRSFDREMITIHNRILSIHAKGDYILSLIDLKGNQVFKKSNNKNSEYLISEIPRGAYIAHLKIGSTLISKKILVWD